MSSIGILAQGIDDVVNNAQIELRMFVSGQEEKGIEQKEIDANPTTNYIRGKIDMGNVMRDTIAQYINSGFFKLDK